MNLPLQKNIVQSLTLIFQRRYNLQMLLTMLVSPISILAGGPLLFLALLDSFVCLSLLRPPQERASGTFPGYPRLLPYVKVLSFAGKKTPKLLKQLVAANAIGDCPSPSQLPLLRIPCPTMSLLVGILHGPHEPLSRVSNAYQSTTTQIILRKTAVIHTKAKRAQLSAVHGRTFEFSS